MALFHTTVLDNQIKALPTVDTASGSVASFDTDLTENLVEVKCQIVAKQASGTPSPDNPLPIEVYDSLTLYHNPINLWNEQWENGLYNNSDGTKQTNSNRIRSKGFIPCEPDMNFYAYYGGGDNSFLFRFCFYDENKTFLSALNNRTPNAVYTVPTGAYFMTFCNLGADVTTYNHDISINYPSTETTYHAFNGAYIPFGQTVANGVLDITTGKLRVTHGVVDLGTLSWTQTMSYQSVYYATLSNLKIGTNSLACSEYQAINTISGASDMNNQNDKTIASVNVSYNRVYVKNTDYTTQSDLQNSMSGVQLVYELTSPIEIQLDSITLQALLNENNIWCDTGDTEVKFLLTVGKKIS